MTAGPAAIGDDFMAGHGPAPRTMKKRLVAAMTTYAIMALLAAFTLDGGLIRNAVWILMAGLAAKTYIAYRAGW